MENSVLSYRSDTVLPVWTENVVSASFTNIFSFGNIIANDGVIKNGRKIRGKIIGGISKTGGGNTTLEIRLNIGGATVLLPTFSLGAGAIAINTQFVEIEFVLHLLTSTTANIYFTLKRRTATVLVNNIAALPGGTIAFDRSINNSLSVQGRIVSAATTVTLGCRVTELEIV